MKHIKLFEGFRQIVEGEEGDKKLACALVSFEMPLLKMLHSAIDKEDLDEKGFEDEPHVTLLFGLHQDEVTPEQALACIQNCIGEGCGDITLGPVSVFSNDKFDVLKFDAVGDWLHATNGELKELPHTNEYPDYKPHCTLAYLKPGMGQKYADMFNGLSYSVKPKEFIYSDSDRNQTKIPAIKDAA